MSAPLVDDLAQFIRRVDPTNGRPADVVGGVIGDWFRLKEREVNYADLIAFVERTNPDKQMGAGQLAELIVAEFRLDEEG